MLLLTTLLSSISIRAHQDPRRPTAFEASQVLKGVMQSIRLLLCRWVQALQILTQMLVAENRVSKAVFDSPYAEAAFDEVVSKHVVDLTKFGQAILQSKRTPEKV